MSCMEKKPVQSRYLNKIIYSMTIVKLILTDFHLFSRNISLILLQQWP